MQYFETELFFKEALPENGTRSKKMQPEMGDPFAPSAEVLGIRLRIGNRPLVYNLTALAKNKTGKPGPAFLVDESKDHYLVVHAIGALRTQGRARVEELQYTAEALDPLALQTVDLIPGTKFKELLRVNAEFEAALTASGEVQLEVPPALSNSLLNQLIDVGGGMQLSLCSSADFTGKFTFTIHIPVVQALGIASSSCSWILSPNESKTPLLGDQLLVQSIAVPKGTKSIRYKISGLVKAQKGIFWKQQQQQTPEYDLEVTLDPSASN